MKKFASGRRRLLTGGLAILALAAVVTSPGQAVDRRTWVNEHIQHTVFRPSKDIRFHGFFTSAVYLDSINTLGSIGYDPGPIELRAFGGARNFLGATADGRAEQLSLDSERLFYGVELGRSYYHRESGAIRLGWIQFPQTKLGFITFGFETSRRFNANTPWFFRLLFSYWLNALGKTTLAGGDSIHLSLEMAKTAERTFLGVSEWALLFSMVARSPDMGKLPDGRYDVLAFSLSPTAKWQGSTGNWEASLDFRVFLDSEKIPYKTVVTHPSVLAIPGVSLRWGQPH